MENALIKPMNQEFSEYLRDESRTIGKAESISFPKDENEVIEIVKRIYDKNMMITVQGARTGLAAGAVPKGGHVINLSKMNRVLGMRVDSESRFYINLQPGTILSQLRKQIESKKFDVNNWSDESKEALNEFNKATEQFFSPDPTEASATIGGMVACNASGARSFLYGPTREHISNLRVVLYNGQTLSIRRNRIFANGRILKLTTEQGNELNLELPSYQMPKTKNASGYYIEDNMDAIDLFIGSDGTLGVITEIEVSLLPLPQVIWGVSCFFEREKDGIKFVIFARDQLKNISAIEFFDKDALDILRIQKEENPVFAKLHSVDKKMSTAIYLELNCGDETEAQLLLKNIGELMELSGGNQNDTWVARNDADRNSLLFFRHAIPESVNMLIDKRRRINPVITKLGTDMSVPSDHLVHIMDMYHTMLEESGLQSAIWGHIGNSHVHVNILPRDEEDYNKGKALYKEWAKEVTRLGGAVSAEHGVGKLKAEFLTVMYGQKHIDEMAELKSVFDPKGLLGAGNMFAPKKGGA